MEGEEGRKGNFIWRAFKGVLGWIYSPVRKWRDELTDWQMSIIVPPVQKTLKTGNTIFIGAVYTFALVLATTLVTSFAYNGLIKHKTGQELKDSAHKVGSKVGGGALDVAKEAGVAGATTLDFGKQATEGVFKAKSLLTGTKKQSGAKTSGKQNEGVAPTGKPGEQPAQKKKGFLTPYPDRFNKNPEDTLSLNTPSDSAQKVAILMSNVTGNRFVVGEKAKKVQLNFARAA